MKAMYVNKTSKLSIELFNPQLLKETKILNNDDFYDMNDSEDEPDDFNDNIVEITLLEFEETLH
ncbi:MAG: hypothetical protein ACXVPU_08295 [Bacteroidia bacterium]